MVPLSNRAGFATAVSRFLNVSMPPIATFFKISTFVSSVCLEGLLNSGDCSLQICAIRFMRYTELCISENSKGRSDAYCLKSLVSFAM
jgi:hypothetical protein